MKKLIWLLLLSMFVYGCDKEAKVVQYKEVIKPVKYYKVVNQDVKSNRVFSGIAMPQEQAKMSFKIAGTIEKILVKKGEQVKKGQLISTLDTKLTRLQLKEAQIALQNIQVKKNNAASVYGRVEELYENQSVSKNDYEKSKTALEVAKTGIKTVQAKIEQIRLKLSYAKLKAPADGDIAYVLQKETENIGAGMPVVVLNYGKKVEVEFEVPENIINRVKKDASVKVTFESLKGKVFMGVIKEIGISPKLNTPMYPVTVELEEGKGILTGMIAKVHLNLGENTSSKKMIIPVFAVNDDGKSRFVYRIEKTDGEIKTVKKQQIKVGKLTDQGFEVKEGLSLGDMIVTAGLSKMKDGLKVKLVEE